MTIQEAAVLEAVLLISKTKTIERMKTRTEMKMKMTTNTVFCQTDALTA